MPNHLYIQNVIVQVWKALERWKGSMLVVEAVEKEATISFIGAKQGVEKFKKISFENFENFIMIIFLTSFEK